MVTTGTKPSLTVKERRFVDAYLGDAKGNATEAARIAGYKDPGQAGYENKKKQDIRAYIDERLDAETMSSAEILAELSDVGRAEWRDFVTIRTRGGEIVDVKMDLRSKIDALELLGKHRSLFTDKLELNAAESFVQALREFGAGDRDDGDSGS